MVLQFLKFIMLQWYFYKTRSLILNTYLTALENQLESAYNDRARCG